MTTTTLEGFYASGGRGDKKLVYRTDVMRQMPPYPVFPGEKYISLGYKYQLCDQLYRLLTINRVLCDVEYQPDGSSHSMFRQYLRNPRGFAFIRVQNMKFNKSFRRNARDCVHYVSSCLIAREKHFVRKSPKPVLTWVFRAGGCVADAVYPVAGKTMRSCGAAGRRNRKKKAKV